MRNLLIAVLISGLGACSVIPSHIHDSKAADLSARLQTEFAVYRLNQAAIYQNMALNLKRFSAEEDALLNRVAANLHTALVTKAPTLTWPELRIRIKNAEDRRENFEKTILEAIKEDNAKKKTLKDSDLKDAQKAIKALKKKIKAEKARVAAWGEMIGRFQTALSKLPGSLSELGKKSTGLSELWAAFENFDPNKIDSIKDIKLDIEQLDKIKKLIKDSGKKFDQLKNKLKNLKDAPGIALRILELGLELAEINKRRAESELKALRARTEVFEEALVYAQTAGILLADAAKFTNIGRRKKSKERVLVTILDSRYLANEDTSKSNKTVGYINHISNSLLALRIYAAADWMLSYQESLLKVRTSRLAHQDSITRSEINDQAWQAVIASGVDALVEYHKGGFTAEDAANLLRIAQSIALFIIAS